MESNVSERYNKRSVTQDWLYQIIFEAHTPGGKAFDLHIDDRFCKYCGTQLEGQNSSTL